MKKLTDEEIQKMIEEQQFEHPEADSRDLHTYKLLFDALREPPEGGLSQQFAKRVARRAFAEAEQRQQNRLWLWQFLTLSIALPIAAILMLIYQPRATQEVFNYLYEFRWIIVFTLGMLLLIQWADYSLLRKYKISHDKQ